MYSWSMAELAVVLLPPELAFWTARSRMRWRMEVTSLRAPSAVWATEMPSWALRVATLRPPIWLRSDSLLTRPAASSAARLIRKPDDSFSSDLPRLPSVTERFR